MGHMIDLQGVGDRVNCGVDAPPVGAVHLPAGSGAGGGQPLHLGVPARHHAQRPRLHRLPPSLPHLRVRRSELMLALVILYSVQFI